MTQSVSEILAEAKQEAGTRLHAFVSRRSLRSNNGNYNMDVLTRTAYRHGVSLVPTGERVIESLLRDPFQPGVRGYVVPTAAVKKVARATEASPNASVPQHYYAVVQRGNVILLQDSVFPRPVPLTRSELEDMLRGPSSMYVALQDDAGTHSPSACSCRVA